MASNLPPQGWTICDGSLLQITKYPDLFNLIGTVFGGDGKATFAIPDLRGRVPVGIGANYPQGQAGGAEQVLLTENQCPSHTHELMASSAPGSSQTPQNAVFASGTPIYGGGSGEAGTLNALTLLPSVGGTDPHNNVQPFLALAWIICIEGEVPPFKGSWQSFSPTPWVGQLSFFGYTQAPKGWLPCNGAVLPVNSENELLYATIGTAFGGNGSQTFAIPDLQGRVLVGASDNIGYEVGVSGGEEQHPLIVDEIPAHSHFFQGSSDSSDTKAENGFVASTWPSLYNNSVPDVAFGPGAVTAWGIGAPHENRSPFLALACCLAVDGYSPVATEALPFLCGAVIPLAQTLGVPSGLLFCDGGSYEIEDYPDLFGVIGAVFGGDGKHTFCVPDLRNRIPIGAGEAPGLSEYAFGQAGGANSVVLEASCITSHTHFVQLTSNGGAPNPASCLLAEGVPIYTVDAGSLVRMNVAVVAATGGGQAHNNMMPFVTVRWYISCVPSSTGDQHHFQG